LNEGPAIDGWRGLRISAPLRTPSHRKQHNTTQHITIA
jgi:hypothetical protein